MKSELWQASAGYFNTALRGIPPRTSVEAAHRTIDLWSRGELDWKSWLDEVDAIRAEFATLIGVDPARVGVGHTTAALVNVVAANLKSDARVLVPDPDCSLHRIQASAICALGAGVADYGAPVLPDYRRRPDAEIALEGAAS